jgi:hypothetical protein
MDYLTPEFLEIDRLLLWPFVLATPIKQKDDLQTFKTLLLRLSGKDICASTLILYLFRVRIPFNHLL